MKTANAPQPKETADVRPFQEADREQVYDLYKEVFGEYGKRFGEDWPRAFRSRWQWAQQENLYPQDSPRWVLTSGEGVVGFLATIPVPYWINGTSVIAHTPCDYMVHPDHRFHGIKLMRKFFRSCDNCVTCDDIPATIKLTQWLGAKPVGQLVRYVKILDGRALGRRQGWSRVPASVLWMMTQGLRWSDRLWRIDDGFAGKVELLDHFDWRFDHFFNRVSGLTRATALRNTQFLKWRYGNTSPHARREIGVATDANSGLIGYVIFYLSGGPSRIGYVLDLQVLPFNNVKAATALLGYAVERLRGKGAWTVRYYHVSSPFNPPDEMLNRYGFVPRGGYQLLVKFRDERLAATACSQSSWNYSYGDSEASHAAV